MDAARETDFAWYEQRCSYSPESFEQELIDQPTLVRDIGMRWAYAKDEERRAKAEIKEVEGRERLRIQGRLEKANERSTKDAIEAHFLKSTERVASIERYHDAVLWAERWGVLFEAIKAKGFSLHEMGESYKAGYLSPRTIRADGSIGMTNDEYEERKKKLSATRPSLAELKARAYGEKKEPQKRPVKKTGKKARLRR